MANFLSTIAGAALKQVPGNQVWRPDTDAARFCSEADASTGWTLSGLTSFKNANDSTEGTLHRPCGQMMRINNAAQWAYFKPYVPFGENSENVGSMPFDVLHIVSNVRWKAGDTPSTTERLTLLGLSKTLDGGMFDNASPTGFIGFY